MEFINAFSIMDFLAYLFPGILDTIGIFLLLQLTPLKSMFNQNLDNLGTWIFLILTSYIIGVIVSGITSIFIRNSNNSTEASDKAKNIKNEMYIDDVNLQKEIKRAFADYIFNNNLELMLKKENTITDTEKKKDDDESEEKKDNNESEKKKDDVSLKWDYSYFYVCRSAVLEFMPNAATNASRESAYRQLRMNLVGSIVILTIAEIMWVIAIAVRTTQPSVVSMLQCKSINCYVGEIIPIDINIFFEYLLISISILFAYLLIKSLKYGMDRHEAREVRETLTAFLSGYKNGIFDKKEKKK